MRRSFCLLSLKGKLYQTFEVSRRMSVDCSVHQDDLLGLGDDYQSFKPLQSSYLLSSSCGSCPSFASLDSSLNRFSSKLRYFFCMLIFFQVLLQINNGKRLFSSEAETILGLFVSILSKFSQTIGNYFKSKLLCIRTKKFVCFTLCLRNFSLHSVRSFIRSFVGMKESF